MLNEVDFCLFSFIPKAVINNYFSQSKKLLIMSFLQKKVDIFRAIRFGSKRFAMFVATLFYLLMVPFLGISQNRYVSTSGVNTGDCSLPGSPCLTIQYAVDQAIIGDNINVGMGTYNENVNINQSVSLLGTNATVQGSDISPGTFHLPNGVNNVTINGFTIIGYDTPNPAIEKAAIYLTGNHDNITIINNTITANGEGGLLDESGGANTNFLIQGNTFDGKTFVGPTPGDCGFTNQFSALNVPRQLVVIQGATDNNIQFLDNIISGTTGGTTTAPGCETSGQGNSLVTIDATNVDITGNVFSGIAARYGSMLRTRGTQVSISDNTFDGSNLIGTASYYFYDADALVGGTPNTIAGVFNENTFLPNATFVVDPTSGTTTIFVCLPIELTTDINNSLVTTNADGTSDSTSFSVCNIPANILINSFVTDVTSPFFKVKQLMETDNVTITYCVDCVGALPIFDGAPGTASLVDPTQDGTLIMKFIGFFDINGNNTLDLGECPLDTVVYVVTVQSKPSGVTCPADIIICNNINKLNLAGLATPIGGIFSGVGIDGDEFFVSAAGLGTHTITYVYTDIAGCPNTCVFDITVYNFPTAPQLEANPDQAVVCVGDLLTVEITSAGDGGSGVCVDEYRFSTDDGASWSSWVNTIPSFQAVLGTNIIESRRICDLGNCPSEVYEVSWDVNEAITAVTIDANPASNVCLGATNVQYSANVSGGTGTISYAWCAYNNATGTGACNGGFTPGGDNALQSRNWTASTGPKSVGVIVSQEGCPDVSALFAFEVTADPIAPTLNAATPTSGSAVCESSLVSATFNAGTSGTGTCTDEFQYSTDNGVSYAPYIAGTEIEVGTETVIIQTRRNCDGLGCDGAGEAFATIATWSVNLNPTVEILPIPAEVCQSTDLLLNGNPTGGSETYVTHEWSSAGTIYLDDASIPEPTFNSGVSGLFELIYTVSDGNGCTGSGTIEVEVFANPTVSITPDPAVACPGGDLIINTVVSGGLPSYSYLWSGVGASSLDDNAIASPKFNNTSVGEYELIVTITDAHNCNAADTIVVVVEDVTKPEIFCPTSTVTMSADQNRCSAVVCFPVTATDNCPIMLPTTLAGHTFLGTSTSGHTYFYSNATMNWEQANSAAVALGGHLVSITSPTEQSFLSGLIPNGPLSQFWIGLRYSPSLEQFKWTSGEPVAYTNWGAGQPGVLNGDYVYHFDAILNVLRGWYDGPALIARRYIVEFEGYPVSLVSGLPSGSNFPVGITEVTYSVTDLAGNTATCTFDVEVTDDQAPKITCPSNIVIDLDPLECKGIPTFADAVATDNCPSVGVTLITPLASGAEFSAGVTNVTFEATDASGNTAQCTFTVTVNDYVNPSLACKPVQLSLDMNCEGILTPTTVLTGWADASDPSAILLGCLDNYEINIIGSNGALLGDTADRTLLGKTLDYTIRHKVNGFTCWNTVTIEDKIAPTIVCRDITVNCLADIKKLGLPIVADNCNARAVLVNEVHELIQCDALFAGKVTRSWKAVDDYGNESAVCTSVVYIERSDLSGITFPSSDTLVCNTGYATDDKGFGYPSPSVTGTPTYGGAPIYPISLFNMTFCNASIDYEDRLIIDTPCKKRILRTWTISEWWCSTAIVYNMPPQFIDIIDNVAPIIPQLSDITVTTQSRSCDAAVSLPKLNITDNCTLLYHIYINATLDGAAVGTLDGNGGLMKLGVGNNQITYTALDECGNTTKMSYRVTVKDNTDPVAICDQHTTISIKGNGYTEVTASAVDDGSFDECGAVTLKIRRMEDPCGFGADTAWFDKVGFCCTDANTTRMVQLLVTDAGGNTNMCMVSVNVQDKVNPTIECPANLTVSDCLFTFDPSPAGTDIAFGAAIITDNCPANNTIEYTLDDKRTQCGIGLVERTMTVFNNGINYGTCSQTITFENNEPFLGSSIVWPKDYIALGQCSFNGLEPETLPDSSAFPIFTEDACDLVGMRHDDLIFPFTTNGACYKIIRTWTVIDWCQKKRDGTNPTWTHEQEIKVIDNVAPVLTVSDTTVIFKTLACSTGLVTLSASATDCTPAADLRWNYTITQGAIVVAKGTTNAVVDSFKVGEYNIAFTVEDRCGNLSAGSYDFEVVTLKAPTATCHFGLSAPLVLMDTDGNGTGDTPMLMLTPEFFNNKSSHSCGYDLRLSFSADVNDKLVVFDCDGLGEQDIQLWVTDENGNTSYCSTYVIVQDNDNLCPATLVGVISGKTIKENNEVIQDVTLELKGGEANPVNTNYEGNYAFVPMNAGGNYQVIPNKDGDDANGVSTLDIVMIQRHILGIEKLKSPYKMIAADANNSGKITAADLIDIRKLILGVHTSFPNNTSWKFVDAGFVFPDPKDPWATIFDEKYNIDNLAGNMNIDFIGVKIGDVNDNAKGRNITGGDITSRSNAVYHVADRQVSRGEIIEIPVYTDVNQSIYGMQISLESSDVIFRDVKEGALNVSAEDFVINGSNIALSIAAANGKSIAEGEVLFTIEVEVLRSGKLSNFIQVGRNLRPEVYVNADIETKTLALDWRTASEGNFTLIGNHPNPWNSNTMVTFEIPTDGMVSLKVKDYTGRKVLTQVDQFTAGVNTISLQKSDLIQSGVYIYEIKFGDKVLHGKMIMID